MNRVYLLLGSNLEDRDGFLKSAKELIELEIGGVLSGSSIYESEPWGFQSPNSFLNQVLLVSTSLDPASLLSVILQIEKTLGRTRHQGIGYKSRMIDIDILFFNNMIIHEKDLEVPHPRLHERMFTLLPLMELDEDLIHPVMNKTIRQLTEECKDHGQVAIYSYKLMQEKQT